MKKLSIVLSAVVMAALTSSAASEPGRGSGNAAPDERPLDQLTFTNRAGETYTVADLGEELRNLRDAVDRTMPVLAAFNENFATNSGQQSVVGAISGILSGVLNRGETNSARANAVTNFEAVVGGLLGTNAVESASLQQVAQQLLALQSQLQPVSPILEKLSVNGETNAAAPPKGVIGRRPTDTDEGDRRLEPTGRSRGAGPR